MSEFLGFIAFIVLIFLFVYPFILSSRVTELKEKVRQLEDRINELESPSKPSLRERDRIPDEKPISIKESIALPAKERTSSEAQKKSVASIRESVPQESPSSPKKNPVKSQTWEKVETIVAQNWTGILGTIILVMGVGFLAIYAALKVSPMIRFLMVLGIAAGLYAVSLYLLTKEFWKQISYWLKSASGAVVLFACVGAASLPGMKWVGNEILALVIVLCGITINLSLAWFASLQRFASLHVVLSLLALAILPFTNLVFCVGVGVTVFSAALSYKAKWEYHLLQTVVSFLIVNFFFKNHIISSAGDYESTARIFGLTGTGLVGVMSLLVHYRKVYATEKLEILPFITHFVSWLSAGIGFALYSTGSKWNAPILILISILLFLHARRARKIGIRWLYLTDTLVSLGIAFLGVVFLGRWELGYLSIILIVSVLFLIFFIVVSEEKEEFLRRIGGALLHFSFLSYLIILWSLAEQMQDLSSWRNISATLSIIFLTFVVQTIDSIRYSRRSDAWDDIYGFSDGMKVSPSGILSGFLASALCYQCADIKGVEYFLPVFGILLLFLRQRTNWNGLGIGLFPFIIAIHSLVIYAARNSGPWEQLVQDIPLIAFCVFAIPLSKINRSEGASTYLSQPGAVALSLHIVIQILLIAGPVSPILPGILWLLFSIFYLEFYVLVSAKSSVWISDWRKSLVNSGVVWGGFALTFVALFIGAHILVHLQSEIYIGIFKVRLLIQIFAIGVFLYWANISVLGKGKDIRISRIIIPLFWELSLLTGIIALTLEIPSNWLPVVWILLAFLTELFSRRLSIIERFHFYSLILFWISCIHTAFLSSSNTTPSSFWTDQEWVGGLISLFFQTAYLIMVRTRPSFQKQEREGFPGTINRLVEKIQTKINILVFYPLFLTVALFLFWSFDAAFLTLLWMTEVFVVFLVGLFLKENHFRYISLSAMVICLLRLIFWDLSQSSTITRALVFLGVGGILILMNTIYSKYRSVEGKGPNVK
ncbi:membrane protein, PF10101 family [Leptospira inadai serovar Lyme str. 10]|uniref:Membrane protein, PF10101 family n=2 Tax=Leptospira inadai serovar Lyme TaxID=293084 RepID=V6H9U5_9LEPT|nr:membrane protein [Leptospira inadai]EQA34998.1 membrane protein, PF10101 family [Leptospira inadai serovar Lyme str. 10]PNV75394.1 hypothetical protein BES34_009065 [Leptospira inadai serovar Lyme]